LFGSLGPLAAAFLLVATERGRAGCRDLLRRMVKWPGRRAFLAATAGPAIVLVAALIAARALTGHSPDLRQLGRSAEFPGLPAWGYVPASILFFGFGEEVGWRGYLIPLLQQRLNPRHAALSFVPFWAAWHLPLFFARTGLATMNAGAIAGWIGSLTVGSVLQSWLLNAGRGSVLAAALFHGLVDVVFLLPDPTHVFPSVAGTVLTVWGLAVLFIPGRWGIRDVPAEGQIV
jgi:membrane protease YdiL (CAAX protease family)